MIYQTENGFVISSRRVWLPGVYDTKKAARYAFQFPVEVLRALQDNINPDGRITTEMLREAKTWDTSQN